jgi:HSP20 family molecular chaperone IbpA
MADIDKRIPVRVSEAPGKASASGPPKRHMDELDHKFKDYLGRLGGAQVSLSGPRTPSKHRSIQPQERWRQYTDLFDSGSDYRVLIEVPGIPKEEIDISVSNTEARIELGKETAFYEENAGPVGRRGAFDSPKKPWQRRRRRRSTTASSRSGFPRGFPLGSPRTGLSRGSLQMSEPNGA